MATVPAKRNETKHHNTTKRSGNKRQQLRGNNMRKPGNGFELTADPSAPGWEREVVLCFGRGRGFGSRLGVHRPYPFTLWGFLWVPARLLYPASTWSAAFAGSPREERKRKGNIFIYIYIYIYDQLSTKKEKCAIRLLPNSTSPSLTLMSLSNAVVIPLV